MNVMQVMVYWGCILFTVVSAARTRRESEQRPMKLSWVPIVEPSELKNAQSLMIGIHPLDLDNIKITNQRRGVNGQETAPAVTKQRGRALPKKHHQKPVVLEDDVEDDQPRFVVAKAEIERPSTKSHHSTINKPIVDRPIPKHRPVPKQKHNLLNRQNDDDEDANDDREENENKKLRYLKPSINRPLLRDRRIENNRPLVQNKRLPEDEEEEELDFQPRAQSANKRKPVVEDDLDDEDEESSNSQFTGHHHPFQGREQKMPGEKQSKQHQQKKKFSRLPVKPTHSHDNKETEHYDEDDDDSEIHPENYTPIYMFDNPHDPAQEGSSRNDDDDEYDRDEDGSDTQNEGAGPLEEFVGYYDVADDDRDDGNRGNRGRHTKKNSRKVQQSDNSRDEDTRDEDTRAEAEDTRTEEKDTRTPEEKRKAYEKFEKEMNEKFKLLKDNSRPTIYPRQSSKVRKTKGSATKLLRQQREPEDDEAEEEINLGFTQPIPSHGIHPTEISGFSATNSAPDSDSTSESENLELNAAQQSSNFDNKPVKVANLKGRLTSDFSNNVFTLSREVPTIKSFGDDGLGIGIGYLSEIDNDKH